MKSILINIFLITISTLLFSQVNIPSRNLSNQKTFNLKTSIKNTGNQPVKFQIQSNNQIFKNDFINDSTIVAFLTDGIDKNEKNAKTKLLIKTGQLLKSVYFKKYKSPFSRFDDIEYYQKKYAPTTIFWSRHSMSDSEFFKSFVELLLQTKYFDKKDFREIRKDNRSFGEVNVNNRWIMVDVDPSSPVFINKNNNSPNGYASYNDLSNDTSLIEEYHYEPYWNDQINIPINMNNIEHYKRFITTESKDLSIDSNVNVSKIKRSTSEFTLCEGCELTWKQTGYIIDLTDDRGREVFDSLNLLKNKISYLAMNNMFDEKHGKEIIIKLTQLVNGYFPDTPLGNNTSLDKKMASFLDFVSGKLFIKYDNYFDRFVYSETPLNTIEIKTSCTLNGENLEMPLLISQFETNGDIKIGNEKFSKGIYEIYSEDSTVTSLSSNNHLFLVKDIVSESKVDLQLTCTYNPFLISFVQGFKIILSDPDKVNFIEINTEQ